jgi:hypothetical protein
LIDNSCGFAVFIQRSDLLCADLIKSKVGNIDCACHALALFLLISEMRLAFFSASAFEDAPQARRERSKRVGLPSLSFSGPELFPIRARNDALRGLFPDLTGGLRLPLAEALPLAFRPPLGFFPSFRCQAGVLDIS